MIKPVNIKFDSAPLLVPQPSNDKSNPYGTRKISSAGKCLQHLTFRIGAIFRAIAATLGAICLLIASGLCLGPFTKFGYELWLNSVFAFKLSKEIAFNSFNKDIHFNSFNLLNGDLGEFQSEFSWHLNLGLLRRAYEKTNDPKLKNQIQFLAANYLAKATPMNTNRFRYLDPRFDLHTQIPPFRESIYHRESCKDDIHLSSKFNQELAIGDESPLILTDTDELTDSFSLGFTVFTPTTQDDWAIKMKSALNARLARLQNQNDLFTQPLNFLFDLTELFQDCIHDKAKGTEAKERLSEFRKNIERTLQEIAKDYPDIDQEKLVRFVQENLICIAQVNLGEIAGIKLLPFDPACTGSALLEKNSKFMEFVEATGLYINRVNLYRHVQKDQAFAKDTRYTGEGPENIQYFQKIEDLTANCKLFTQDEKPYVQILGNAALKLLNGWIQEVGQARWEELNQDPALREILDATLYKIKLEIANAQLWKNDFTKFSKAMELTYAELSTLLELTAPFIEEDFSAIYREQLNFIPDALKPHVKAGLAKTAMNIFTAINCSIAKTTETPMRAYCKGLYYEETGYMGRSLPIQEAILNPDVTQVNLYATQFYSNIVVDTAHTTYFPTDVIGELRQLLEAKPQIEHLTVSIDSTIDFLQSPKAAELLKTFEPEIQAGKLNFVFFRSGQKFDMLGMDNYYGAPYYMVNNGGVQWQAFEETIAGKAYKTDSLSLQWFCLAHRYAADSLDAYRREVFDSTRKILDHIPEALKPHQDPFEQRVRVNTADPSMLPAFIDIKLTGPLHRLRGFMLTGTFHHNFVKKGIKSDSRMSFGFYHPDIINITANQTADSSSVRISPGLNPEAHQEIIEFFNRDLVPRL